MERFKESLREKLSQMHANATDHEIDLALGDVCDQTVRQITYKIMYSADKYIDLSLQGVLVWL